MGVAVITGVGRRNCIGAAAALRLAGDGWDVVMNRWRPADEHAPWHGDDNETPTLAGEIKAIGRSALVVDRDLEDPSAAGDIFGVAGEIGPGEVLVLAHTHHVSGPLLEITADELDRHMAINVRANVLLIQALVRQYPGGTRGRIIALTSDAIVGNLGFAINPGPNDTGWMSEELKQQVIVDTPLGRLGTPTDTADLISFLCSEAGGWMNGQLLNSNGGIATL